MGRTACTEPQCLYKGAIYFYIYQITTEVTYVSQEAEGRYHTVLQNTFNFALQYVYEKVQSMDPPWQRNVSATWIPSGITPSI